MADLVCPDSYNTRKAPRAQFIQSVPAYVEEKGGVSGAIMALQTVLEKYNFMLRNYQQQKEQLQASVPELEANLAALENYASLPEGEPALTYYELAPGVYAQAELTPKAPVALWLGSRVMVEYSPDEAAALLTKNLADVKARIDDLDHNIQFLKEQATVSEVSISRVFNWDVQQRKK